MDAPTLARRLKTLRRTVEMLRLFAKEVLPHVQAMSAPRVAAE